MNTRGVFYITNNLVVHYDTEYYSRSTCFFNAEGSRSQSRFVFSVGKGGDILYGGHAGGIGFGWRFELGIYEASRTYPTFHKVACP